MIILHVEANTPTELVQKALAELGFSVDAAVNIAVREMKSDAPPVASEAPVAVEQSPADAQRRRGRPRKVAPAEAPISAAQEAVAPNTSSVPAAPTPAAEGAAAPATGAQASVSDAELMAEAQKLSAHSSVRAVKALLHEFGVERVREVAPDKRAAFVAKIKEMLAQPAQ